MKLHQIRFLPLLILVMLVNILSQTTHETGHHLVYQVMGHDPVWAFTKLVQIWETPPNNPSEWVETRGSEGEQGWLKLSSPIIGEVENGVAAAAGPLAGLLGAALGLIIASRSKNMRWRQIGLAFSLTASLVAVLYYLRAPIRSGGDEADIAVQLGIAKSLIEIPLGLAFAACLAFGLRQLPSWRARLIWLGAILLGSVATGIMMVFADPLIIAQVDAGNGWFRPIVGYSLPVFVLNVLTFVGLWLWARWHK
ncbi:MAG: hypothetical protein GY943_01650 [Chloroflexi bacterium]|nr:hypothetical protein [Chloroflexota bacterium]